MKPSRVYVVIGVNDVKDYTSNNITFTNIYNNNLSLRLRTHSTQNEYKKNNCFEINVIVNRG